MIAITASLCVLLAVPGVSGSETTVSPTPVLTVRAESTLDQTATLAALTQFPAMRPVLAESLVYTPVKPVVRPKTSEVSVNTRRTWMALTALQHGAATFDAWSTRQSVTSGHGRELNPLMKPFAGSGAMYGAMQIAPLATDWWSRRMMRSNNPTFRKLWWLPQVASSIGFTVSGVNNLRVANGH